SKIYAYYDNGTTSGGLPIQAFAPISITDGGATGSDIITVQTGSNFLGSIPATITQKMPQSSSELNVSFTGGFNPNDLILVSQGGNCTLMEVTQVQNAALKLQHNPGGSPTYNPPTSYQNSPSPLPPPPAPQDPWPPYFSGAKILNMGQLTISNFSINTNGNLQSSASQLGAAAVSQDLVKDIVSLQAQYGIAPAGGETVSNWVDATGSWAAPSAADVKRIKAIRLVVIARSGKKELSNVTGQCTNASGAVNNGPCAWNDSTANPAPVIDLSANPDWRKYRYRVYQTIIPLRNVIWADL
ncbi:MAG: PilW family protein, partial [Sulfuricellaceae bacterium]|nr:PilW family protein [Sulfuricellaceae bacterium]